MAYYITGLMLLLACTGGSHGAKILIISIPGGSHTMNFLQISTGLMERGHDVHAYMNKDCKDAKKMTEIGIKVHTYTNELHGCFLDDKELMDEQMKMWLGNAGSLLTILSGMHRFMELQRIEGEHFFNLDVIEKELRPIGFDLCIVDALFMVPNYQIIPYKLGIPVVSFLAVYDPRTSGVPTFPSFTPYINNGKFTNEMNFMERVQNILMYHVFDYLMKYLNPLSDNSQVAKYAPEMPPVTLEELQRRSKLWLIMSDLVVDYPQIRMPHVVDVGGLNTRPARPLSEHFQKIADGAEKGLIVVSFGSYVAAFPEDIKKKLLDVFAELEETVIWRLTVSEGDQIPANVITTKWLPQNDLLAHPNTKLFLTHGGANGQFEALYNAVPMLGLPIFGDQIYNSRRMAKKGMGIHMPLKQSSSQDILAAVRELLSNDSYKITITKYSKMFKDRPMTPIQRMVYWVEHVLEYGADHLLSPALEFPVYKLWSLDVMFFLGSIAILLLVALLFCMRYMWMCCVRMCRGKSKKE